VASGVLKTAAAIVISPLFGFVLACPDDRRVLDLRALDPAAVDLVPAAAVRLGALYSLGHGRQRRAKNHGIIWMRLIASGFQPKRPLPFWVVLACQAGWPRDALRRLAHRQDHGACGSPTQPSAVLRSASGAIRCFRHQPRFRVHDPTSRLDHRRGLDEKLSAVRWGVAGNIIWAWIFTIRARVHRRRGLVAGTEYF